jgi:hypothetical protein
MRCSESTNVRGALHWRACWRISMRPHKNHVAARPEHGLAFTEHRGVRSTPHLKSGQRWLTDGEAHAYLECEATRASETAQVVIVRLPDTPSP